MAVIIWFIDIGLVNIYVTVFYLQNKILLEKVSNNSGFEDNKYV